MTTPTAAPGEDGPNLPRAPGPRYGVYLTILLIALLAPLALIAAFNLAVDPFIYRWPRLANAPEPAFSAFDRETHYNLVVQAKPRAILLGNSQTQHGLIPNHWNTEGPVVNAAAVGAEVPEIRQTLMAAQNVGHVSRAIIGLDFALSRRALSPPPGINPMYQLAPDGRPRLELLKGLVTFPMLQSSAAVLLEALRHKRTYGQQGQALDRLYQLSLAQHGGAMSSLKGRLGQFRESLRQPPGPFDADLRALRDTACQGGTRLQIYLTPMHAVWLQTILQAGQQSAWGRWKRDIVTISTERPDCGFEVWDFNTYNPITTETLPPPGGALQYSWDGIHFRTLTGDMILTRMQDFNGAHPPVTPEQFGVRLTPQNVEAEVSKDRQDATAYQMSHQSLIQALARRQ